MGAQDTRQGATLPRIARAAAIVLGLSALAWLWHDASGAAAEPRFQAERTKTVVHEATATKVAREQEGLAKLEATEPPAAACQAYRGEHCADPRPDDYDADGFSPPRDCNDRDSQAHPEGVEVACNGMDEDCDGSDTCEADDDGDGFRADADCDDDDAARSPRAREIPCNQIDEDCSGHDLCDRDGDRVPTPSDCDDRDPQRHAGAKELLCDGIDQNCDGHDCCEHDGDGDGAGCADDCDDRDSKVYPGRQIEDWERKTCIRRDLDCDGRIDGTNCL